MFLEIAEIEIKPGSESAFEAGVREAEPLFLRAKGCHGVELHRTVEHPSRYKLIVQWETVDDHMVGFRESADFQEWRRLAGPHFAKTPEVVHTRNVLNGPASA